MVFRWLVVATSGSLSFTPLMFNINPQKNDVRRVNLPNFLVEKSMCFKDQYINRSRVVNFWLIFVATLTDNVYGAYNVRSAPDDKPAMDKDELQSLEEVFTYFKGCSVVATEMVLLMSMRVLSHFARDPGVGESSAFSKEGLIIAIACGLLAACGLCPMTSGKMKASDGDASDVYRSWLTSHTSLAARVMKICSGVPTEAGDGDVYERVVQLVLTMFLELSTKERASVKRASGVQELTKLLRDALGIGATAASVPVCNNSPFLISLYAEHWKLKPPTNTLNHLSCIHRATSSSWMCFFV